jgi:hypothetical protein
MEAVPVSTGCTQIHPWGGRIRTLGDQIFSLRPLRVGGVRQQLLLGGSGDEARLAA